MRISSLQTFNRGVDQMMDLNKQVNNTQNQISSGTRVIRPSDDPVAASRLMSIEQDLASRDQYKKDINLMRNRVNHEETVLKSVNDLLIRVRELTTQAGNGALTLDDKNSIAAEIKQKLNQLEDMVNTQGANGEYLFGGYKSSSPPFVDTGNENYRYAGDEGQRMVKISNSVSLPASDSGKTIFMDIESANHSFATRASGSNTSVPAATISVGLVTDQEEYDEFYPDDLIIEFQNPDERALIGNPIQANFNVYSKSDGRLIEGNVPYVAGKPISLKGIQFNIEGSPNTGDSFVVESSKNQDMLTTISRLNTGLTTLGDSPEDLATYHQLIADTIINIQAAEESVLQVRAEIGARLNTLDSTEGLHEDLKLVSTQLRSDIRDLDFAEATSRLSFETFVLEAAQQSYVRVANLSLFDRM